MTTDKTWTDFYATQTFDIRIAAEGVIPRAPLWSRIKAAFWCLKGETVIFRAGFLGDRLRATASETIHMTSVYLGADEEEE